MASPDGAICCQGRIISICIFGGASGGVSSSGGGFCYHWRILFPAVSRLPAADSVFRWHSVRWWRSVFRRHAHTVGGVSSSALLAGIRGGVSWWTRSGSVPAWDLFRLPGGISSRRYLFPWWDMTRYHTGTANRKPYRKRTRNHQPEGDTKNHQKPNIIQRWFSAHFLTEKNNAGLDFQFSNPAFSIFVS